MTTIVPTAAGEAVRPAASGRLLRFLEAAIGALVARMERRAAIKALHELDDRALRDIGISRCQIEDAVGGALNPQTAGLPWKIAGGGP